jgi:hypothetical protein
MTSMSPDIVDYRFKMAATKAELEITFERQWIATRFQMLPPHFRLRPTSTWHWGHCPRLADVGRRWKTTKIQDGGHQKTGSGNNLWTASDGAAIPTAIPTLSTMPDFTMSLRTLPDVVRLPKFKMATMKPEVEITFDWWQMALRFQILPPYFPPCPTRICYCHHRPTSPDIARRWLTIKNQDGGHRNRKWK